VLGYGARPATQVEDSAARPAHGRHEQRNSLGHEDEFAIGTAVAVVCLVAAADAVELGHGFARNPRPPSAGAGF
jgi:hypothetical protein